MSMNRITHTHKHTHTRIHGVQVKFIPGIKIGLNIKKNQPIDIINIINRIKKNHITSQSLQKKNLIKFHNYLYTHTQINLRKLGIEENLLNLMISTTNK